MAICGPKIHRSADAVKQLRHADRHRPAFHTSDETSLTGQETVYTPAAAVRYRPCPVTCAGPSRFPSVRRVPKRSYIRRRGL